MGNEKSKSEPWRIEDQEWWQKYSAMVQSQEIQTARNIEFSVDYTAPVTSGNRYIGSGSGSLGIRYVGSGSGSLGIRYIGSGSGSLGIRYVGSGSGRQQTAPVSPEEQALNPYIEYDRSRFPGEGSGSDNENGILGYGLGLI